MMLNVFFVLVVAWSSFPAQEEEKISFNDRSVLVWSDFKGNPDPESTFFANTSSGMSYDWSYNTANSSLNLSYKVKSYFYPKDSWIKSGTESDALLAHEQLHFAISELHARILHKALNEYVIGRNIRRDLKNLYTKVEQKRRQMQLLYDEETRHSIDTAAQLRWEKLVTEYLNDYQQYAM